MGKIKNKIDTLKEQIDYVQRLIKDQAIDYQPDLLHGILANLQTTHAWVNLPDFHQAAMMILDNAYAMNDAHNPLLEYPENNINTALRIIKRYLENVDLTQEGNDNGRDLEWVSAMALIAVAKYLAPGRQLRDRAAQEDVKLKAKEVGDGR